MSTLLPRTLQRGLAACAFAAASVVTSSATAAMPSKDVAVPAQCRVPDDTALSDAPLPRLARRMNANDSLMIVVIGSGSATGSGTTGKQSSFPFRLQARLEKEYPRNKVQLVVLAAMGQTAPAMLARFPREVLPLHPALVIWQTGSADVARGVSVAEFGSSLERGIIALRDKGSDVLLVDGQFSPRASLVINTDEYRETVRWNARRFDVPMFRRYDTMQYWWSNELFDLDVESKTAQLDVADRVHDCVAALLFRLIQRGIADPRS